MGIAQTVDSKPQAKVRFILFSSQWDFFAVGLHDISQRGFVHLIVASVLRVTNYKQVRNWSH